MFVGLPDNVTTNVVDNCFLELGHILNHREGSVVMILFNGVRPGKINSQNTLTIDMEDCGFVEIETPSLLSKGKATHT